MRLARTTSEACPPPGTVRPRLATRVCHGVTCDTPRRPAARAPAGDLDTDPGAPLGLVGLDPDRSTAVNGGDSSIPMLLRVRRGLERDEDQRNHATEPAARDEPRCTATCRAWMKPRHDSIVSRFDRPPTRQASERASSNGGVRHRSHQRGAPRPSATPRPLALALMGLAVLAGVRLSARGVRHAAWRHAGRGPGGAL